MTRNNCLHEVAAKRRRARRVGRARWWWAAAGTGLALSAPSLWLRQAPAAAAPSEASIRSAVDLLRALERADDDLRTLQADIQYDRRFELQGDRHIRQGRLLYRVYPPAEGESRPRRVFEIRFHTLILPEQHRQERDEQIWVFDGRWLIEKRPAEKVFHAREIAPPGSDFDPLRIGEGPFPVPLGQRTEDILARFEAQLLDPEELFRDNPQSRAFVKDTWRLRLIPKKEGSEDEEFRDIQLWYRKGTLLPRLARTVNRQGDVSYVQLINVKRNEPLPEDAFDVATPDPAEGWEVQVDRLREPAP